MDINNRFLANMAMMEADSKSEIHSELDKTLSKYDENPCVTTTISLRNEAIKYLQDPVPEKSIWLALTSPYMGMDDFDWFLMQLSPLEEYIALNEQLYDSLLDFNLYDIDIPENIPITYISGSLDYACPVKTIEDYLKEKGVKGTLYILDECGHNVQYTKPHEVSNIIKDVLKK